MILAHVRNLPSLRPRTPYPKLALHFVPRFKRQIEIMMESNISSVTEFTTPAESTTSKENEDDQSGIFGSV